MVIGEMTDRPVAVFLRQVDRLVEEARTLAKSRGPSGALFEFFASIVGEGATNRGLVQALAGTGFDFDAAMSDPKHDFMGPISDMLARAQKVRAVRAGIDAADVRALIVGCLARKPGPDDPDARDRLIEVVRQGLKPH